MSLLLKRLSHVLLATAACFFCVQAMADASGSRSYLEIRSGSNDNRCAVSYIYIFSALGGTASGRANLSNGVLKSDATAPSPTRHSGIFYSIALSQVFDDVVFGSGVSGTSCLYYHWDGTLPAFDNKIQSTGTLSAYIATPGSVATNDGFYLVNDNCFSFNLSPGSTCEPGTSIDQMGSIRSLSFLAPHFFSWHFRHIRTTAVPRTL